MSMKRTALALAIFLAALWLWAIVTLLTHRGQTVWLG